MYQLQGDELVKVQNPSELKSFLCEISTDTTTHLDDLFDPTNYLISPFNTTEEFLKQEYFLNRKQEEIKKDIVKFVETNEGNFSSVTGAAGTGKTLLIYDIAMTLMKRGKKVLVLHCGPLNEGQTLLVEKYGWHIKYTRYILSMNQDDYDLIIVDEAQRMRSNQWDKVVALSCKCIFSFDEEQYPSQQEKNNSIGLKIKKLSYPYNYKLTEKVRTNKEVMNFLKQLFDRRKNFALECSCPNVEICYFDSVNHLNLFQTLRARTGWTIPKYTPSKPTAYDFYYEPYFYGLPNQSAHTVIGQEYDNVVAVLDNRFFYSRESGILKAHPINDYNTYSLERMFYQIVTRTRKKLCIAILNNKEVFERCLEILSKGSSL